MTDENGDDALSPEEIHESNSYAHPESGSGDSPREGTGQLEGLRPDEPSVEEPPPDELPDEPPDDDPVVHPATDFFIAGLGASAGGVQALSELLSNLPEDVGMAFVVLLHLSSEKESALSEILDRATDLEVLRAEEGMKIEPNKVYVLQPGDELSTTNGTLHRSRRRKTPHRHRPIDTFFRSLADDQTYRAIGVILTGGDQDGVSGLAAIKSAGGVTLVQDPSSAAHPNMPKHAIDAGVADKVLPLERMAQELADIASGSIAEKVAEAPSLAGAETDAFWGILDTLRAATGVDFRHYKKSTLARRIGRRMFVHRIDSPDEYLELLRQEDEEVWKLYRDILIMVTEFFRDPELFDVLKSDILPNIAQRKGQEDPIRVWVAGCSTGEEAYSLAIILLEYFGSSRRPPIQIFATDVNDSDIQRARSGIYPERIRGEVSAARLERFFTEVPGGFHINKMVRELCIFAPHDVTRDPPFTKLDLVMCRNVMIFFTRPLQERLLSVFHYGLSQSGFLALGSSESVGARQDLFEPVDKKHKIFSRRPIKAELPMAAAYPKFPTRDQPDLSKLETAESPSGAQADIQREADRMIAARYAPASVVVDNDYQILQFRGDTSRFLGNPIGEPSFDLIGMAREGLAEPLQRALRAADKRQGVVRQPGARLRRDDRWLAVDLEVAPLSGERGTPYFLVYFHETELGAEEEVAAPPREPVSEQEYDEDDVETLRQELESTRYHLQSLVRGKEAANEELRAAHEEIQSSNEELQSINEELETAKEELQSTNEELTTVNEELHLRNEELTQAYDDLNNLFWGLDVPIIMLDADLSIRRFTPGAERVAAILASDAGRPITDIRLKVSLPDLEDLVSKSIHRMSVIERETQDEEGRWILLRVRPYKTADKRIDGAVLTFMDIDELKRNLEFAREVAHLNEVRNAIHGTILEASDPGEVIREALTRCTPALNAESSFYAERERGEWTVGQVHGLKEEWEGARLEDQGQSVLGGLLDTRGPVRLEADSMADIELLRRLGAKSVLALPLGVQSNPEAALFFVYYQEGVEFTSLQRDFYEKIAVELSIAVENLHLRQAEHRMAESLRARLQPTGGAVRGFELGTASHFASRVEQVGGDFIDVFEAGDRSVILMGDVVGKGLEATSVVEVLQGAVRALSSFEQDPGQVLTAVNETLCAYESMSNMATLLLAFGQEGDDALTIANAGHTAPVLCGEECRIVDMSHGPPVGARDDSVYESVRVPFLPGNTLLLYTDGVVDARRDNEFFGEDRLLELTAGWQAKEPAKLAQDLLDEALAFQEDGPPADDCIVSVVRRDRVPPGSTRG